MHVRDADRFYFVSTLTDWDGRQRCRVEDSEARLGLGGKCSDNISLY